MKPSGGTELLVNNFIKYVANALPFNLIVSICNKDSVRENYKNVIWQHLSYDQPNVQLMNDRSFVDSIDHFIYISNWQLEQFKQRFPIESANNQVIKNAIEPIPFVQKPKDKIKLIYTSMPFRGLDVLLDAFEIINRDDVELTVFSSNIIYGDGFAKAVGNSMNHIFDRCRKTKNVIYRGYAFNNVIRKELQQSHIMAYPSTFEETSCLAVIEAGAAGCKIVTTRYGALPETCGDRAIYIDYNENRKQLAEEYAVVLNKAIDDYTFENNLEQSNWFNERYSWINRAEEWKKFINDLQNH